MSAKVKVCHVISGYHRTDARIFFRQCLSLRNHGFDVCILTNDGLPNEIIDGVTIISCTDAPASRRKELLMASHLFYDHAISIDADAYQLHSPELLPLGVKLKRRGKSIVYDAHEDMPNHILEKEWLPPWSRQLVSRAFAFYMNRVLKRFDQVISPHSHVVHSLQERLGKGVLIANFPLVKSRQESSEEEYRARRNLFCYSGTVYSYSNQATIAAALSELPDAHYQIAGYIDDEQRKMLRDSAAGTRISCLDRLSQVELAKFYGRSIAGIVVYDYKLNLGYRLGSYGTNKIFEYMEAGLPIICTDYDLWKDIVDRYKCGICVKPGDVPG
ncbi:MAG: glycosyltransferase, partial [Geobacteraceae bacterium]